MPNRLSVNNTVADLPSEEDAECEFKSSLVHPNELKKKISAAASGFWNAGGGIFVIGVNEENGEADNGFPTQIGRQSTEDWIDQAIARTSPPGQYSIKKILDADSRGKIIEGNAVFCIGFEESPNAPHQAYDDKYYIRAGAHTSPARHFLVEALWTRRQKQSPSLIHIVRHKPEDMEVIQFGVISSNEEPAFDVTIDLNKLPEIWKNANSPFPMHMNTLSVHNPLFVDLCTWTMADDRAGKDLEITITYFDKVGHKFTYSKPLIATEGLSPFRIGRDWRRSLNQSMEKVQKSLSDISRTLKK